MHPVAIGHKHKDNMIIKTCCNNTLNEMMNPKNNKNFYCAELKEFIGIVVHSCSFMANQPSKRSYDNHAGGNSKDGATFRHSCNVKDLCPKLVS